MKIQDIRSKTKDELLSHIADLKKELLNLRFQKSSGQLENASRFRVVRRTIARVKTVLSEQKKAS